MPSEQLIIVVQPDPLTREQIVHGLRALEVPINSYDELADSLQDLRGLGQYTPLCVVAPLDGDTMTGPDFQRELGQLPHVASVVFCVTHAKTDEVVDVMRRGAVAVVELGSEAQRLLAFVAEGLERSASQLCWESECRQTLEELGGLNVGEHQVLQGIIAGKLNKEIAQQLNVSIRTIEQRRREVFRKMHVQHPASLARKVIEAAQVRRLPPTLDERGKWLEGIRLDFAHALAARSVGR